MWPWRRGGRGEPVGAMPGTAAAVTGLVYTAARAQPWRSLPPVQRLVGEHPLVNPPAAMQALLASWRSPAYLAPLGHLVSDAEPAGVIEGASVPVAASGNEPMPLGRPIVDGAARRASGGVQRLLEDGAPPVVGGLSVPRPPSIPQLSPDGSASRHTSLTPSAPSRDEASPGGATAGDMAVGAAAGIAEQVSTVGETGVRAAVTDPRRSVPPQPAAPAVTDAMALQRTTSPLGRRLGLGPPTVDVPLPGSGAGGAGGVARGTGASLAGRPAPALPSPSAQSATQALGSGAGSTVPATAPGTTGPADLGAAAVSRSEVGAGRPLLGSLAFHHTDSSHAAQRAHVQRVGVRPIGTPHDQVHHADTTTTDTRFTDVPGADAFPFRATVSADVAVQAAPSAPGAPLPTPSVPFVPIAVPPGQPATGEGRERTLVVARLIGDRPLRSKTGMDADAADSNRATTTVELPRPSIESAVSSDRTPVASRLGYGSVPVSQPTAPRLPGPALVPLSTATSDPEAPAAAAQRMVDQSASTVSAPTRTSVQRAEEAPDVGAARATVATTDIGAGAGRAGGPDELVERMFEPLLRRLKAELVMDRDRRGARTDLRY